MATNRKYRENEITMCDKFITSGVLRTNGVPISGDPVVLGQIPGVALTNVNTDGEVTAQLDGVFLLPVKGIDQSGNSAVKGGDALYFTETDNPPLSKKNTGVFFGYALGDHNVQVVASAATTSINVKVGR